MRHTLKVNSVEGEFPGPKIWTYNYEACFHILLRK